MKNTVTPSSGNVYEDMGFAEPNEALYKADLAIQIGAIIAKRGLTQERAAVILGTDQPTISKLLRGRLRGFTSDRLFSFLLALGQSIEIRIRGGKSAAYVVSVNRSKQAAIARARHFGGRVKTRA